MEEENKALSFNLLGKDSVGKKEITSAAVELSRLLDEGEISALLLLKKFKSVEKLMEEVKPFLTKFAIKEVSAHGEKVVALNSAEYEIGEFGTRYDYSTCKDPKWNELKAEVDAATKALKEREEFLKGIKGHITSVNEETGEIIEIYEAIKTSTTGVKCTIK